MFKLTFLYRRKVNKKCNHSSVQAEKSIGLQMSATQHYGVMVWLSSRVFQFFFSIFQNYLQKTSWSIKLVAQTITKTSLWDKVSSKYILQKDGLCTLNKMFSYQTNKAKDLVGRNLFPNRSIIRTNRLSDSLKGTQPVPDNNISAANLKAMEFCY